MKGLLFTEFLNFVEQTTSYEMVDKIIRSSHLKSNGIYTAVGLYDYHELILLIQALSKETEIPYHQLLTRYGEYLFHYFLKTYPEFFRHKTSTFHFLSSIENYIHIEVKHLYPEVQLPHFQCKTLSANKFELTYTSHRPFADLAEGLIRGCISYHKDNMELIREDLPTESGAKTKFTLIKLPRQRKRSHG